MLKTGFIFLLFFSMTVSLPAFAGGDGSQSNPYQVSTLPELNQVRNYLNAHFIQINDIDVSSTSTWNNGQGFNPIGESGAPFSGSYDGQGYSITGLFINRLTTDIGLFARCNGASLSNIKIVDCDITGFSRSGSLVGLFDNGTITNCGVTGEVTTDWCSGGLIGRLKASTVSNSFSKAVVDSYDDGPYRGGLTGYAEESSVISNCYARGNVEGYENVGGLIGTLDNSTVLYSYSTGLVNSLSNQQEGGLIAETVGAVSVTNSYWDTQTSQMSTSAGGTGRNSTQLKNLYNFHADGWDFICENIKGTNDIWDIGSTSTAVIHILPGILQTARA